MIEKDTTVDRSTHESGWRRTRTTKRRKECDVERHVDKNQITFTFTPVSYFGRSLLL